MISVFTTITDPDIRGDAWYPALLNYSELADELIIIDGSTKQDLSKELKQFKNAKVIKNEWSYSFNWDFIGKQFQKGYEAATGDWVIHADIDFLFHDNDFNLIKRVFEDNNNEPALSFWKYQFILPDRYNLKSRLVIAVNKGKFGDRIKFNSGGDLCQPSLDGVELSPDKVKEARIPFYNYEKILKNYDQVVDDVTRMAAAWAQYFGNEKLGSDPESAFDKWAEMLIGRFKKPQQFLDLSKHPVHIVPAILMLQPHQFGYSGFGMLEVNKYMEELEC